jgi:hypothetical protein
MIRDYILRVRLNRIEREKLKINADRAGLNIAEFVRDIIRSLK